MRARGSARAVAFSLATSNNATTTHKAQGPWAKAKTMTTDMTMTIDRCAMVAPIIMTVVMVTRMLLMCSLSYMFADLFTNPTMRLRMQ